MIDADVTSAAGLEPHRSRVRDVLDAVNRRMPGALWEPFSAAARDRFDGALADPAQAPLCLSMLREGLAPHTVRAGVGIGVVELGGDAGDGRDAHALARRALQLAIRDGGLTRYLGTGEPGDVLLEALCRLVDPILKARSAKQWEAVAAYRELGHQQDVARRLGVSRQSVGERLAAGRRRDVDEADAAVSAFLGLTAVRQPGV